ncbi:MAG: helix-turn-helix transcriptional regulator [Cyclobacteriaceae bacterium]|nr:helix-turn-helix transcriptional regulator [Cyclobacteriaceae bacterium]
MEQENFTLLENKTIGNNISVYRKIRGMKASDVAERLGIKESSYTRYERGEASITVDIIQQVAQILEIDPLMILTTHPSTIIESGNNSPGAILGRVGGNYNFQSTDEKQTQLLNKLLETVIILNERITALLEKDKK